MLRIVSFVVLIVLFIVLQPAMLRAQEKPEELTLADVDRIMEELTVPNCEKAIAGYKNLLKTSPNSDELYCKLSTAYIRILEIKTSALLEEKKEYKPLLKELGKIANDYAKKARAINPKNKDAIVAELMSYGYYSASFGIVKAIFKGAAGTYKDLANLLIKMDEKYMDAVGYRALGKLYYVAPWPAGSSSKALKFFKKAIQVQPNSLYAHYYIGVLFFEDDEFDKAEKEFNLVITQPPLPGEKHIIQAYKDSAREYIKKIAKERD